MPTTVAVIGCGPGGMSFCHALESRRRTLQQAGDEEGLADLPIVTCYERASAPGGVWRAKRSFVDSKKSEKPAAKLLDRKGSRDEIEPATVDASLTPSIPQLPVAESMIETTNMYEALWTNGPKESIEYFDYTFDEHFQCALPVYMPREDLLDYITSRVTKHCPDFFEKYVKFNTTVQKVKYNHTTLKFEVTIHDWVVDKLVTVEYDKCIWAAGENGKPMMPAPLVNMFREGGFQGRLIHSSDTANFEADVKGKRVLLIGGSYSAEDLALMAVKVGAEKVYVSSRTEDNVAAWTTTWPLNKVEILEEMIPVKVTEEGKCIQFAETSWEFPDKWETAEEIETSIPDIDTVIFCTGYKANMTMLDDELKAPFICPIEKKVQVPSDWKMTENEWTEFLGDVEPGDVRWYNSLLKYPDIYHGVMISNPNMMFIDNLLQPNPLFATDVSAWLLLAFITGTADLPSREEMMQENLEEVCRHMQNASLRYYMDKNYSAAWDAKIDDDDERLNEKYYDAVWDHDRILTRLMARAVEMAGYPVSLGTYDDLNDIAEKSLYYGKLSYYHRENTTAPENKDADYWKTFRDYTDAGKFKSLFTGTTAVPLAKNWLDIDPHDRASIGYSVPVIRTPSDESRHLKDDVADAGEVRS